MVAGAALALTALLGWGLGGAVARLLAASGHTAANWRGLPLPQGAGLALLPATMLGAAAILPPARAAGLLAGVAAMGAAGLLDDVAGAAEPRGWVGHARALASGRVTCGALKALTGVALALALAHAHPARALVLVLAPNALNSIDTRPGRAIGAYVAATALLAVQAPAAALAAAPSGAAALGIWPAERQQRLMLGDAGANALGFALGYAWSLAPGGLPLVAAAVAAAVVIVGDRVSFAALRLGPGSRRPRASSSRTLRRRSPSAPGE